MAEIANVVALSNIAVEWGNAIRDRTVQRYDNVATRTSENSSPTAGDLAFIEDTGDLDVYYSGAWRHVGPPVGHISIGAAAAAAPGWLLCNGQAVSRTTYASLFTAISTTYGTGDGSTTFNVPDLRGKFPLGVAASGTGNTLGGTGGEIDHDHTGPSHTHTGPSHTHSTPSHTHDLSSGHAQWGHSATETFYRRVNTADYTATRSVGSVLIPNTVSAVVNIGTALGGDTGSSSGTTGSGGTGATGASGTGNTGTNNPPFLALHFFIKT